MNPRAHEIVQKLDEIKAKDGPESVWRPTQQTALMAELMVIIAGEQEVSARNMERFTFWLIALTVVLCIIGFIQIALMFCGH